MNPCESGVCNRSVRARTASEQRARIFTRDGALVVHVVQVVNDVLQTARHSLARHNPARTTRLHRRPHRRVLPGNVTLRWAGAAAGVGRQQAGAQAAGVRRQQAGAAAGVGRQQAGAAHLVPARANNVDEAGVEAEGEGLDGRALPRQREVLHLVRFKAKVRFLLGQKLPQHYSKRKHIRLFIRHPAPAPLPSAAANARAANHITAQRAT
jgi:hypothetical protein